MLSVVYLFALRAGVAPSFVPLLVLALFPVGFLLVERRDRVPGVSRFVPAGIAVLELAWTVVAQAIVGFAIAGRSG